jgi:hypothetical protein
MNSRHITHENGTREFQPTAEVARMRVKTQDTAQRLSLVALRNWEKAITGVVAIPAALALTTAAGVLFARTRCWKRSARSARQHPPSASSAGEAPSSSASR